MRYRRPTVYVPPYNYCDRACGTCTIDKSRCLLYQREMDEQLHREIDGAGEPSPAEDAARISRECRTAAAFVEQEARRLGLDPEQILQDSPEPRRRDPQEDVLAKEGLALSRQLAAFLRAFGTLPEREAVVLRTSLPLIGPKLQRAANEALDDMEAVDAILQAQVAHQALGRILESLESLRKKFPESTDVMLDLLLAAQGLSGRIADRWLSRPCALLEFADDGVWWGPLRDITPTLRHFRA